MSDIIIGIDPGITGAVAVGFLGDDAPDIFDLIAEPASARGEVPGTGRQAYNLIDCASLHAALRRHVGHALSPMFIGQRPRIVAFIECPIAGASNGVRTVGQVNRIIGRCEGVCSSLGAETILVHPSKWRRYHGIGNGGDTLGDGGEDVRLGNKAASVAKACELWPSLVDTFRPPPPLRKDGTPSKTTPAAKDGRAEAALIWSYGCAVARSR